jgi:hypothetical protein
LDGKVFHVHDIEGVEKLLHELNRVVPVDAQIVKYTG